MRVRRLKKKKASSRIKIEKECSRMFLFLANLKGSLLPINPILFQLTPSRAINELKPGSELEFVTIVPSSQGIDC